MAILERFSAIIKSNVNALLDKCENPSKMIDQYLRDCRENLADVKKETAAVMAEEARCKKLLDSNSAEIDRFYNAAKNALAAGKENDARIALSKKAQLDEKQTNLTNLYNTAHENAEKMRQMYNKLVNDINTLESRKATIKAKDSIAKTQKRVSGMSGKDLGKTMDAFDRMEERVDKELAESSAFMELGKQPVDEAEAIAQKYGASASSVDDELAKLKAELAGA